MTDHQMEEEGASAPEFSRLVDVERLNGKNAIEKLEASEEERLALAKRLGLKSLDALTATIRLEPLAHGEFIRATGRLAAQVTQSCSVTLAPVVSHIEESFERTYTFDAAEEQATGLEIELEPEGEEPPDPIVDGTVDLGELVVEELCLAIDPFPRAPGAVFDAAAAGVAEKRDNPFAVLAKLHTEKK